MSAKACSAEQDQQVAETWKLMGKCRGLDPELFHPMRGDDRGLAAARAVCRECEVRRACLDYGLTEKRGVWGGFSEAERRRIRRARRLPEPVDRCLDTAWLYRESGRTTETAGKQSTGTG